MKTALEFVILCSNGCLEIEVTARQKSVHFRGVRALAIHYQLLQRESSFPVELA